MPSQASRKRNRDAAEAEKDVAPAIEETRPSRSTKKRRTMAEEVLEVGSSDPAPAPLFNGTFHVASSSESARRDRAASMDVEVATTPTLVGESPTDSNEAAAARRREKGKGRAFSPPPVVDVGKGSRAPLAEDVKLSHGRQNLLGRLGRAFTCGICMSLFDNPSSLVCGHVFCRGCLEKTFRRELAGALEEQAEFTNAMDAFHRESEDIANGVAGASSRRARSRSAVSPRPPPLRPLTADERRRNLVCPVCRAKVREPPFAVFALRDAADLVRAAETDGLLPEGFDESPSLAPSAGPASKRRKAQEADVTWGGLFPDAASKESKKKKRVHTHGVDDVEDGVLRCWRCNWEIEDGECNHCGEVYDVASDGEFAGSDISHFSNLSDGPDAIDLESDDGDAQYTGPVRMLADIMRAHAAGLYDDDDDDGPGADFHANPIRRSGQAPGRQSHRVDSDVDDDEEEEGVLDEDEPNSEDLRFLADSDEEEEELPSASSPPPPPPRRPAARRRVSTSDDEVQASMSGRVIEVSSSDAAESDSEEEQAAPAPARRAARPAEPISIDSGSESESDEEVPSPPRRRRGGRREPSPDPTDEDSAEEEEAEPQPEAEPPAPATTRRPRLIIQESSESE